MRKLLPLFACLGILFGASAESFAQEGRSAPSDVPRDHWAFRAVDELFRAGILRGYPDATFKGNRPATRYEMAATLERINTLIEGRIRELSKRLPTQEERVAAAAVDVQTSTLEGLAGQIRKLQEEVAALRAQEQDLSDVRGHFERMLDQVRSLRRDVNAMRSTIR